MCSCGSPIPSHEIRYENFVPEIPHDQYGHHQRAEGHGIANGVNDVQPIKEMLLRTEKYEGSNLHGNRVTFSGSSKFQGS